MRSDPRAQPTAGRDFSSLLANECRPEDGGEWACTSVGGKRACVMCPIHAAMSCAPSLEVSAIPHLCATTQAAPGAPRSPASAASGLTSRMSTPPCRNARAVHTTRMTLQACVRASSSWGAGGGCMLHVLPASMGATHANAAFYTISTNCPFQPLHTLTHRAAGLSVRTPVPKDGHLLNAR